MEKYRIELKWAAIFAGVTIAWMILEKIAGFHDTFIDKHPIYTNFFAIPAIIVYVLALRDKKTRFYHDVMTYKQGLIAGLVMTAFVTILSPITQIIISQVITPEYFPNAINYAVSSGHLTQAEAEQYFSLGNYIIQGLIGAPIMGVVTSAIVALLIKTKKKYAQ